MLLIIGKSDALDEYQNLSITMSRVTLYMWEKCTKVKFLNKVNLECINPCDYLEAGFMSIWYTSEVLSMDNISIEPPPPTLTLKCPRNQKVVKSVIQRYSSQANLLVSFLFFPCTLNKRNFYTILNKPIEINLKNPQ